MTTNAPMPSAQRRNTQDADVERVVQFTNYPSDEPTLIESTKHWSVADVLYAIQRLDSYNTPARREQLRPLYMRLLRRCQGKEERAAAQAVEAARHEELTRNLGELKRPHWSVVPSFWMTLGILILTIVVALAAILGLRH